MRTVKIFIASSAEANEDKQTFDLFLSNKNKIYKDRYLFFDHRTWRDFVSAISKTRLQDEYNKYIAECDIVVFLFHTKVGQFTVEEFEVAHDQFIKSGGKAPKIYVYYKDSELEIRDIEEFKNRNISIGHFYDTYKNEDELIRKFDRQLQELENRGFIKPERIDVAKIVKYGIFFVVIPLLIVVLAFFASDWFSPKTVTVKLDKQQIQALPFEGGKVTLQYADKSETLSITAAESEVIFKEIHSKYMGDDVKLKVAAPGYMPIDTMLRLKSNIELPLLRDNSLGVVFGEVIDERGQPLGGVHVSIGEMNCTSDTQGRFRIDIPFEKQAYEQRVSAFKTGYQRWDFIGTPSQSVEWKIVLVE